MRKYVALMILASSLTMITACVEKEQVKPYVRQEQTSQEAVKQDEKATKSEVETPSKSEKATKSKVEKATKSEVETPRKSEKANKSEVETTSNDEEQEEEFIDNGAISDRSLSIGKAYIGNAEFTSEKVSELFPMLSNYTENETTQQVVESVVDYLNNCSEYELINKWQEYDSLEKHQRYALIILTRYEQSFGGYNKSNMKKALSNSDTYKADMSSVDSDIK